MTIHFDFSAKVILVTGGTKGVGRGIAEAFLQAGATVIVSGRNKPETLPSFGDNQAAFIAMDVRDSQQIESAIQQIKDRYERLDVLINNAGGTPFALADDMSPRFSEKIVALNLLGPLYCAQAANTLMQQQENGGSIINIASVSGTRPSPGTAIYGAAKAGLLNLTQSLAVEWAPKVRVNAITAGMILTEQSHLHYGDEDGIAAVAATVPLGRLALPQDIAGICLYLASDAASYLSGTSITAHGAGERPAFLDAANVEQNLTDASVKKDT
ncbi:uncharacterized oxidoreductase MexAM1_META1p0182-like [Ylistrum balloti]|uniref:uncharacterized oxidoreductase MexAM1_META1p0182-like n=1 Tax=Ylistrum balloti TaxID=509963 RepID=UPI0029058EA6|nr:uncharacterized oxidoreductase MexAM1_META1p0182-like [Ylistrum balloti]